MFMWNGIIVDPYKVLEVSHDVTEAELKKRYRDLVKIYHTDGKVSTKRLEDGMRLINQSKAEIEKDISLRNKQVQEKALKEDDYSALDLEGLKKAVITKFTNYITEYQVVKVTCEMHQVKSLKKVEEFFDQGIAVANNCISLANLATSCEDVLRVKNVFDVKRRKFDDNFFADLDELLRKSIMFIYETREVQTVVRLIRNRGKGTSAQEWFTENNDALITIIRFEEELAERMDAVVEEFKEDELYPYVKDEIEKTSYRILVEVNEGLAVSHNTYKIFEDEDFVDAYRTEIKKIFEQRRAVVERRKNKIKYLKFALNISSDVEKILEETMYDVDDNGNSAFDSLVDTLEMQIFNSRVASSQEAKKELKY